MDAATLNQHLEKHLRVNTFPLGIKSLKPGGAAPRQGEDPLKHLGVKVAICQAISIARRLRLDDGVFPGRTSPAPSPRRRSASRSGTTITPPGARRRDVRSCREAGAAFEDALAKYGPRGVRPRRRRPLSRASFVPDTVLVYGNSAQCCVS